MSSVIKIGTRDSALAIWQARQVYDLLTQAGFSSELVFVKSDGDLDLTTPLYAMGVQGIFTRALDIAMLDGRIDLAVHSMKDVPVQLPEDITQAAVLPRGPVYDLLLFKYSPDRLEDQAAQFHIATSSIRRRAQWLHRYPQHEMHDLRGNVQTRLDKFAREAWDGVIFAQAGLERLGLVPKNAIVLDWMLPAPGQGAILVTCRRGDHRMRDICRNMHDRDTALCTSIERDFLGHLLGGCSTPIGSLAQLKEGRIHFQGNLLDQAGRQKLDIQLEAPMDEAETLGQRAADYIKAQGGLTLLTP